MLKIYRPLFIYLFFLCVTPFSVNAASTMQPQLAEIYEQDTIRDIEQYLVSEKYDGVRAIWTGHQLITRHGNPIYAPEWFTAPLPSVWLDGELWTQRQDFDALSGIVRTHIPDDHDWANVGYMVFDMPDDSLPFEQRYQNYSELIEQLNAEHIRAVKQQRFSSNHALSEHLQTMVKNGAEGLMLHLATARHRPGRSGALLKLKPYFDAEAYVIAHLPGKGKYTGMMGALRVRNQQGIEFSVGTGFTDLERANPPPVGSTITYKYHGYTTNGLPRFASFLRSRDNPDY